MATSVVTRLCALLGQAGDPWPDALAYLCSRVGGEVAIALLVTGGIPRRLGSMGPIPPSALQAIDEAALAMTLANVGMSGVWTYAFFQGPEKLAIVAVARRGGAFAADELEVLD